MAIQPQAKDKRFQQLRMEVARLVAGTKLEMADEDSVGKSAGIQGGFFSGITRVVLNKRPQAGPPPTVRLGFIAAAMR